MNGRLLRVDCPACGSGKSAPLFKAPDFMLGLAGDFHVARCDDCGLRFQNPCLPPEDLGPHYPDDYGPYSATAMRPGKPALWHLKNRLGYSAIDAPRFAGPLMRIQGRRAALTGLLPRFVQDGALLEIGCASGARLEMLRDLGWKNCRGVEYGEASAQRARARGFSVVTGPIEEAIEKIPDGSLDVVIASFVLEHLRNPFQIALRLAAKLKPGGQFLFSTLNIDSPDFKLYHRFWYNLDLPRHYVFFRKRDLHRLMGSGFRAEETGYQTAPQDYTGSARYRSRLERHWIDRVFLRAGKWILPACMALAWTGAASRICVRCRRIAPEVQLADPHE